MMFSVTAILRGGTLHHQWVH